MREMSYVAGAWGWGTLSGVSGQPIERARNSVSFRSGPIGGYEYWASIASGVRPSASEGRTLRTGRIAQVESHR